MSEKRIGRYVRAEKIGSGGMGDVWRAWDGDIRRFVALKFLRSSDPDEAERFLREARTAGKLNHPNICAVYETGDHNGERFIAMQLVEGQTLLELPREDRLRIVELIRDAARAVHHAHENGIVHRDLKPGNMMVAGSGRMYVMDFGLAKQTNVPSVLSVSGTVIGTPAYMSPEQARGSISEIGPPSDIYSLGATMYELLAGSPPFQGLNVYDTLKQVIDDDPAPLRMLDRSIPTDLETIVRKCLEKDPRRRYATAGELADDLTRWLHDEPIHANPPTTFYLIRKKLMKKKAVVATAFLGLLVASIFGGRWISERSEKLRLEQKALEDRADLHELGSLWVELVLANKDFEIQTKDPVKIQARLRSIIERVSAFIERRPSFPQAWYVRARGRFFLDDLDGAWEDSTRSLELAGHFAPARVLRAGIILARPLFRQMDLEGQLLWDQFDEVALGVERELKLASTRTSLANWGLLNTRQDAIMVSLGLAFRMFGQDENRARRFLEKKIEADPSAELCAVLGLLHRDPKVTLEWMDRALTYRPHYSLARLTRANMLLLLREPELAESEYSSLLRIRPDWGTVILNRSMARRLSGDLEGAMRDIEHGLRLKPDDAHLLLNRSAVHFLRGNLDRAEKELMGILRRVPGFADAHLNLGVLHRRRGDHAAALRSFEEAIRRNPKASAGYRNRGREWELSGRTGEAMKDYDRAIEANARDAVALMFRALLLEKNGNRQAALRDYNHAIRHQPRFARAYNERGVLRYKLGDAEGAHEDFETAIRLNPGYMEAYNNRANMRMLQERWEEALQDYSKAIELDPDDARQYINRGRVHQTRKTWKRALEDYDRALEIDPRIDAVRLPRGVVLFHLERFRDAEEAFDRIILLNAKHAVAHAWRARARCRTGDLNGAFQDAERAIELGLPERERREMERLLKRL